ncbi:adenine DNA glycosylase-like, partial [Uloborus diversus]|uniref:adenine DNA glycosylase-like n=1 Tax=Uloborus diversus TaxID=327109 RepID=UPI0024097427
MAGKRKRVVKETKSKKSSLKASMNICSKHIFSKTSITQIRKELLSWYDANQRVLPWRTIAASEVDPNVRGYAVWVSEVMLQQTQVATVIPYFNKWIKTWSTIQTLAAADLEDIYKVWAGLGYYSRARRLHEGAKFLVTKMDGTMPQEVEELSKTIPGIGPYSASAIASVAFQKVVGVVDGNVIRVLSRMREVGADSSRSNVRDHL